MSQLQRSPVPGVWYVYDKGRRIAIIRYVKVRGRWLLRSVTFDRDPAERQLIGYFPECDTPRGGVHLVGVHQAHRTADEQPAVATARLQSAMRRSARPRSGASTVGP